jgi:hypothetical protein
MVALAEKTLDFIPAQDGFFNTKARYPAYVAAWGTGKTAAAIARGVKASKKFPGNVGLVVRNEFVDLRDSTMVDFEKYTGLKIDSEKNCRLPNGSLIMFRHGAELSGLQNINLGWFIIEQAEEFETDEQFQILRGRLRLEGVHHFGAVIANTNGHNWVWYLWKKPDPTRDKELVLFEAETIDNAANLPPDFVADLMKLKVQKPRVFRQFVENSWDDYGTDAMFFAEQMSQARREGRIGEAVSVDEVEKVFRVWDIGSVHIAVWFGQVVGNNVNLIDYYQQDDPALGLPQAIEAVKLKGYDVLQDFCGPDIAKGAVNGKTIMNSFIIDEALKLGIELTPLNADAGVVDTSFNGGIEAVRAIFPFIQINATNCADGILSLDNYKRQPKPSLCTADRKEYADKEVHDWASHGGSALRYLAVAYQFDLIGASGEIRQSDKNTQYEVAVMGAVAQADDDPDDILYEQELT